MSSRPQIFLRADGNNKIGLGHHYRMVALAEMLKHNFACTFGIQSPSMEIRNAIIESGFGLQALPASDVYAAEASHLAQVLDQFEIIVLDGYPFDSKYQSVLKSAGKTLISIDDLHASHFYSDIVINHAPGTSPDDYSAEPYTQFYLGTDFALIREPFSSHSPLKSDDRFLKNILLSFGGADPYNFTCTILKALLTSLNFNSVTVVTGSAYAHLPELQSLLSTNDKIFHFHNISSPQLYNIIRDASLAIVPSSTILFEVLASGTIPLTGYYIDNQKQVYDGFLSRHMVLGLGDFNNITASALVEQVEDFFSNRSNINMINQNIKKVFDGKAKQRVNLIFQNLSQSPLT